MTPLTDAELDGLQERLRLVPKAFFDSHPHAPTPPGVIVHASTGGFVQHPDAAMAAAAIRSLRTERDALRKAVKWLMDNQASKSREGNWYDAGCGCCSGSLECPPDINTAIDSAMQGEQQK